MSTYFYLIIYYIHFSNTASAGYNSTVVRGGKHRVISGVAVADVGYFWGEGWGVDCYFCFVLWLHLNLGFFLYLDLGWVYCDILLYSE